MLTFVLLVLALWMRMTLQKVKWTMGSKYPHTCIEEPASQTDGIERKNKKNEFKNVFKEFPEDEATFEDSEAAKLAA